MEKRTNKHTRDNAKKDQRTKETNKTDTRKNIQKTSERKNYNIFSILSQKEPRQESITNKKPKTQKTRIKGEKITKPLRTGHLRTLKSHQRVTHHFKKKKKE